MGACFSIFGAEAGISPLSLKQREKLLIEFKDISAELVPARMIARTIDAILHLLPVERASVFIVDRHAGLLRTFNEIHVEGSASSSEGRSGAPQPHMKAITIPINKGIAGSVVTSAKVVIVGDAQSDPRFDSSVDKETGFHTRNLISVPVKLALQHDDGTGRKLAANGSRRNDSGNDGEKEEEVVAVLQALNHTSGHFGQHDVSVLEFIAMLLAGVLARSALVDEAVREKSKARALLNVAEAVNSAEASKLKALKVMQAVMLGVDCERAAFVLVDEVRAEQVLFTLDSDTVGLRFPTNVGVTGAVISSADPVILRDAYSDSRFNKGADEASGFVTRDLVAVPVIRKGSDGALGGARVMAVLEGVNSKGSQFEEEHVELLQTIALQVADRLIPELIQDMVEASSEDHGLGDAEVERMRQMLWTEFATPKPNRAFRKQTVRSDVLAESLRNSATESLRNSAAEEKVVDFATIVRAVKPPVGNKSRFAKAIGKVMAKPAMDAIAASARPAATPQAGPPAVPPSTFRPDVPDTFSKPGWSLGGMLKSSMPSLSVLGEGTLFTRPRGLSEDELITWDVDILSFNATELMQLAAAIFKQAGVLEIFSISADTLAHFVAAIGGRYHANPYHNFNHGVHVLLGSWLLARDELRHRGSFADLSEATEHSKGIAQTFHNVEPLEALHVLALLIAAIGHDVDHPGVNNAFLCASNHTLAMRYNDLSVLENHHAATTFEILAERRCNMLSTITAEQHKEVRALMIAAILATDMAHHQTMVKELSQEASNTTSPVPVAFTLRVICHVADLGNCAINWQLSKVWALRVCDEAINQAHKEQMLGLPCGKLTPYTDEELNARQLVFVDGWVYPLFKAAAILYPGVKERLKDIAECREACKIVTKQNARNSASA